MDPTEILPIADWPYPKYLNDLQRFLGFFDFYRRFIPNYSGVAGPLIALTGSKVNTEKGLTYREAQSSFITLKELFCRAPVSP